MFVTGVYEKNCVSFFNLFFPNQTSFYAVMGNSFPWQTLRSLVKYHAFYFPLFSFNLTLTIMAKGLVLIHDYVVTIIRQTDNQTDRRARRWKEIFDTLYHLFRLRSLFHCGSFNL